MTLLGSSVCLTGQLEDSPSAIQSHLQGSEWVASAFILPLYSTPVNEANVDHVCAEGQSLFLESNSSFGSSIPDSGFTSLYPTQDGIPWTTSGSQCDSGLVLAEDPVMNNVPQTSVEVPGYFTPSTFVPSPTSYATNLDLQIWSVGQDMEASLQAQTMDSYGFSSSDMSLPGWGSGQPVAGLLVRNPSTSNGTGPTAGIYSSLYPVESTQEVGYEGAQSSSYTVRPRFEQQSMLSEGPVGLCKWQSGSGTVCEEVLTFTSLPEHLSIHGIKNLSRAHLTKCNWVGCKRKRPMNRESIVRHIREVHLGLKRPPKRMQEPCL